MCGGEFNVKKSIPRDQIPGYDITNGEIEMVYKIHEKFICSVQADSVSKTDGITITEPKIGISTTELFA